MTKYITVKLTEDQARELAKVLGYRFYEVQRQAEEYQMSPDADYTSFLKRVQDKIFKALAQAKS